MLEQWLEQLVKLDEYSQKKILGVAYIPVMNHVHGRTEEVSEFVKGIEEFHGKTDEEVTLIAFHAYSDEEFKAYGDLMVTECLNYFPSISGAFYALAYNDGAING